jgi:hypothetical protein
LATVSIPTELEVVELRRNPWMTAASCIPWALIPVALIASLATGSPYAMFAPHLGIVGLISFIGVWQRMPRAIRRRRDLRVDSSALSLGKEIFARSAITKAELVPTPDSPVVRVERRARLAKNLVMRNDDEAHALLTALGYDVSQTTAAYKIRSLALVRRQWLAVAALPFLFGMLTAFGIHFTPLVVPLFILTILALFFKRSTLVVGADGLLLRWLWIREFIAMKDISLVSEFEQGRGNNRVRGVEVFTRGKSVKLPMLETVRPTIERRIHDVLALSQSVGHVDNEALVLERGDLPLRDWIGRLKALGAGATATLRTQAVVPEQLWRVACDTTQPAITRAAAAVALAPTLDESGRVRLADLAKTTAAPKLRIALERAAEDVDDASLEEALHAIARH